MRVLDIEIERASDRVLAVGDVLEGRRHALDRCCPAACRYSDRGSCSRRCRAHPGWPRASARSDCRSRRRRHRRRPRGWSGRPPSWRRLGQRLMLRILLAGPIHDQLDESVAGAGGGRRAQHLDLLCGQRRVDLVPGRVGIGHQLAVDRHFLGQRQPDLASRSGRTGVLLLLASTMPSKPILTSVISVTPCLAQASNSDFLIAPRGVGDVRVVGRRRRRRTASCRRRCRCSRPPGSSAGTSGRTARRRRSRREDRRRADDADLVAGECALAAESRRRRCDEEGERHFSHWKSPCLAS